MKELRAGFRSPPDDSRIMMCWWWWFGPFVEKPELAREPRVMREAGIGGVEVAFVYPLSVGETRGAFLSEELLGNLTFAAVRARELGMRFDLTLGSGWSFGSPHIDEQLAARHLRFDHREVDRPHGASPFPAAGRGKEFLGAYVGSGSLTEPPAEYRELGVADGYIDLPEGAGRASFSWPTRPRQART